LRGRRGCSFEWMERLFFWEAREAVLLRWRRGCSFERTERLFLWDAIRAKAGLFGWRVAPLSEYRLVHFSAFTAYTTGAHFLKNETLSLLVHTSWKMKRLHNWCTLPEKWNAYTTGAHFLKNETLTQLVHTSWKI
jgi:hypothetical protein